MVGCLLPSGEIMSPLPAPRDQQSQPVRCPTQEIHPLRCPRASFGLTAAPQRWPGQNQDCRRRGHTQVFRPTMARSDCTQLNGMNTCTGRPEQPTTDRHPTLDCLRVALRAQRWSPTPHTGREDTFPRWINASGRRPRLAAGPVSGSGDWQVHPEEGNIKGSSPVIFRPRTDTHQDLRQVWLAQWQSEVPILGAG